MKLITLNLAIVEMVIRRGGICYCVFYVMKTALSLKFRESS